MPWWNDTSSDPLWGGVIKNPLPKVGEAAPKVVNPPVLGLDQGVAALNALKDTSGQVADTFVGQGRNFAAGVASLPWKVGGMGAATVDFMNAAHAYVAGQPYTPDLSNWMNAQAQETYLKAAGGPPKNFGEEMAGIAGGNPIPIEGVLPTVAFTLGGAALQNWWSQVTANNGAPSTPLDPSQIGKPAQAGLIPGTDKLFTTIDTIGGPAKVSTDELTTLGITALTTIGMMWGPKVVGAMKFGQTPRARPVFNAAPGTQDISTLGDLGRTYDDASAGLMRLAKRAGVDPAIVDEMQTQFHTTTRTSANSLGDSATKYGNMSSPTVDFKVPVSIADLSLRNSEQVTEYLNLKAAFDEFQAPRAAAKKGKKGQPGIPARTTVHGLTQPQMLSQINALEAANPELRQLGQHYNTNTKEVRKVAASGEYAIITKKRQNWLNTYNPNSTHVTHNLDNPLPTENAFVSAADAIHSTIRERLENEAKGRYITALQKRYPSLARTVTDKQIRDNPQWRDNIVTYKRRGKPVNVTTSPFIADVLKFDPAFFASQAGNVLHAGKSVLENTTTGFLAPWFSFTSAARNYMTGKHTMPFGLSPTMLGTLAAIPRQLLPQMARAAAVSLDRGSAGWLNSVLGPAGVNALSARLMGVFDTSLYNQLESFGSARGSILQQQIAHRKKVGPAVASIPPGPAKQAATNFVNLVGNSWKAGLNAVHNAPQYSAAFRAVKKGASPEDAAATTRTMTGDTRIGGESRVRRFGVPVPIRMEGLNKIDTAAMKAYGAVTEFGRTAIPWTNVIMQSAKRLGAAYVQNPVAFTSKLWLYTMMPAAAQYLWNRAQGQDAVDYMMNRRSDYDKTVNWYFALPGKRPEEGLTIPGIPQELTIFKRMMEVGLDHAFGSSYFSQAEDFRQAALAYLGVIAPPVVPPPAAALMGAYGVTPPMGVFGSAYTAQDTNVSNGLPSSIDLAARALAGGVADIVGSAYAAWTSDPGGVVNKAQSAVRQGVSQTVQKAPVIRDIFGFKPVTASTTAQSDELFRKQDAITRLADYYATTDRGGGQIDTSARSKEGAAYLGAHGLDQVGQLPGAGPGQDKVAPPGLVKPPPTNPLYKAFMVRVYQDFKKDSTSKDIPGVPRDTEGFLTLWGKHADLTKAINTIKPINAGNYVTWQKYLTDNPKLVTDLKAKGVDTKNPTQVRSYLVQQRQDVQRVLLSVIRAVEQKMSMEAGRPIRLEDLDPYGAPGGGPGAPTGEPADASVPY